ncbi:MAG: hypothetical protein ACLGHX_01535 [Acidimicrobiia bacterium]
MPAVLVSRIAMYLFVSIFLIPLGLSSLRGLGHTLTCRAAVESPFQVILDEDNAPVLTSATVLSVDEPPTLCGGLRVNISIAIDDDGRVAVTLPIENSSPHDWHGTVQLDIEGTRIPVSIGHVPAQETASETIELRLPEGTTEFVGSLLVGP